MQNPSLTPGQLVTTQDLVRLALEFKRGANWFYWIAALSLVNTIIVLFGGTMSFIIGLGITQLIDGFAQALAAEVSPTPAVVIKISAVFADLLLAGLFCLFGLLSGRKHTWAFIVGIILYALDALIFLLITDWIAIAFHVLALFFIFNGLRALLRLNELAQAIVTATPPPSGLGR